MPASASSLCFYFLLFFYCNYATTTSTRPLPTPTPTLRRKSDEAGNFLLPFFFEIRTILIYFCYYFRS